MFTAEGPLDAGLVSVLADRRPPMGSQEKDNFILSKKKTNGEKEQRAPPTDSRAQSCTSVY